ncbi:MULTISPECIES: efflux RND transporter periplasmic adaptor subunit [Dysgonomonas]|uniref:HlyD family efflux transporter periplasmic adaptor subunit n=1 Tax=Dysgonomonas mossii TaxID=163665 RepID=A0A4Y9INY1_9BACT|nr:MULTISPECIES: HlyD family efflux transporter periplasmic adaptor subunit [Dysgonomonas]MBF0761265.1 HlyD family efflux transporter periplasmic adaptor subunit [Dysgonomonas mossii]MBN9302393.1 HlyD family efflux transporter periplasmic adaptor subunit [Dysgonomonas mossii]OJX64309.1 MAG: HlyD family secretion protein [Dysgonomonas sp. 37-18]TFU90220.1 HlyD family efflux transporter periplasmic adaptor subunit [Dysgonomonas mossii]
MDREIPLSEQRKERRKQIIRYGAIIVGLAIVVIIVVNFLQGSISSKNVIIGTVDRGTIEVTVNASGKVIPLTEEIIVSPINSRILEVYKEAGDSVNKDEPILKLELASIETDYKQKLDEKEMKKSKLIQSQVSLDNTISDLQMQLQVKDMKLKQLQTELKNERYLDSIGASTSDKVRQAALNYEVAKLELQQLKEQIVNEKKNASAEVKVQQLDLSIFEKSLAESARLLKDARILSPQRATLTYVNNQIGSQVSAGAQIAIVSDLSHFKVLAEIADSYAEKLSSGAKAIIKIGQLQLEGTVVNITPSVKNGVINFTVMLKDSGNSRLRSGLKTDVYVTHGIQDDVLRIPNSTYYIGAGEYELWVVKNGEAEKKKIKLGESSFEYVEVISGLEKGEQVIISDMNQYKNKQKLKIN